MSAGASGRPEAPSADGFAAATGVSRETLARLQAYAALLERWQPRINLVARDSMAALWRRHMLDSAQLLPLIPPTVRTALDLGSGAGFPGLVLAILGVPGIRLVEADARKCAFLREAARAAGLRQEQDVFIVNRRLGEVPAFAADLVTARAVAALPELLAATERFRHPGTICLFHKGLRVSEELTGAGKSWRMTVEQFPSRSDPTGTILRLTGVERERSQ